MVLLYIVVCYSNTCLAFFSVFRLNAYFAEFFVCFFTRSGIYQSDHYLFTLSHFAMNINNIFF